MMNTGESDITEIKFYKKGFRLIKTDNTNKFYRFDHISEIRSYNDRIEVINWRIVDGKKQNRMLTIERMIENGNFDIGQKILDYWNKYNNITLFAVSL